MNVKVKLGSKYNQHLQTIFHKFVTLYVAAASSRNILSASRSSLFTEHILVGKQTLEGLQIINTVRLILFFFLFNADDIDSDLINYKYHPVTGTYSILTNTQAKHSIPNIIDT